MKDQRSARIKNVGRMLVVYLGGAWVFIEAFNFLIDKYGWDTAVLDVIILTIIFGLPASIIYAWFNKKFTRGAIILLVINGIIAASVITINLIRPESMDPTQLQLLKSRDNQKKLAESIRALAILPFNNYTNDEEQVYLVSGIHDALINEMGQISALRVPSSTSSSMYVDSVLSLKEIATELKVDAIIEGAVMGVENGIQLQLKLISAFPEEQQLWSNTYDIKKENILNLYSDVLKTIAREINITLSPQEEIRLDQYRPVDPEAYDTYLKGRFNLAFLTPEGIKLAEEYFLKAIEIDPQFAPAYGGLAGIWVSLKQLSYIPPEVADPKVDEYLKKAFDLDSANAEVWRWYASKLGNTDFNWNACNKAMDRCLNLNPNFAEARAFYAHFLMIQNRWDEAWEQMDLALDLDPFNPLIKGFYGVLLMHSARFDEFLVLFEPFDRTRLGNSGLFIVFSKTKQYDKAINQLKKILVSKKYEKVTEILDEAYRRTDFTNALKVTAHALAEISDTTFVSPSLILQLYAIAGEREQTMYWIEKLYIRRDPNLPYWAIKGPLTKDYQNEPRYIEIMERINLR
jgi:TolB-like protein/Tfp pilus assembly protein PilF